MGNKRRIEETTNSSENEIIECKPIIRVKNEATKKRQKSSDSNETTTQSIDSALSLNENFEEDDGERTNLDEKIEKEEQKADNIVIKDLMGSVRGEKKKVFRKFSWRIFNFFFQLQKVTDEEKREIYDNVYSKLLILLERCQKYVEHLNTKVKQSIAEHQAKRMDVNDDDEDDMKRTGLLKKYYEMTQKDIQKRQPKQFTGTLKPCTDFSFYL